MSCKPIICVLVTARASWARVKTVVEALRVAEAHGRCDVRLVWAGSAVLADYGDVSQPGDERVHNVIAGTTLEGMASETGLLTVQLAAVFARIRPALVLVVADRHEVLAGAVAASYQNIPVAHLLAGERTGSIDDRVRDAISAFASVLLAPTSEAMDRLERMGLRGSVCCTGCPSIDLAVRHAGEAPKRGRGLVVVFHATTTEAQDAYGQAAVLVDAIRRRSEPVTWLWPGADAGGSDADRAIRVLASEKLKRITFRRHIPVEQFLPLLNRSSCIVGNSSVGLRECAYLGVPAVNIGTRQDGRERARNVRDVGYDVSEVDAAISSQVRHGRYSSSPIYGSGDAGERVARVLLEFVGANKPRRGPKRIERVSR